MGSQMIISMVAGAFGAGYFFYGKKNGKFWPMISGAGLMAFPYIISDAFFSTLLGLFFLALPFLIRE